MNEQVDCRKTKIGERCNVFCHPQSVFFPLFKARSQFLIMEILTLKPLKLRKYNFLQSLGQALGPASVRTPS